MNRRAFTITPRCLFAAALMALVATVSPAQDYGSSDWGISSSTINDMIQSDMINRSLMSLQDSVSGSGGGGSTKKKRSSASSETASTAAERKAALDVSWLLSPSGDAFTRDAGLNKLASGFPADKQQDIKAEFTKGIIRLGDAAEQAYGVPKLNLATGVTAMVAGAYAAYTGEVMPDSYVKPLYLQFEKILATPAVTSASVDDKATVYQIGMGTGILLTAAATEVQNTSDTAEREKVRAAGAEALQSLFGIEASRISFGEDGFSVK